MEILEEFAVSNDALYELAVTDDALYDNFQNNFAVNDTLYSDQSEFDIVRNVENRNMINCEDVENSDMINCEGAKYENMMIYDWYQLINEGAQGYTMKEVKKYRGKQEFRICCYRVERSNGTIWRRILVYMADKPFMSRKNNSHKVIYVTKLINKHKNHSLNRAHYDFRESLEFTVDMIKEVEFFVTKMKYSSQQIYKALEENYSVKIYIPVLYWVIQQFRSKSYDQTNDASHLYEELLKKKEIDSRWYVEQIKKVTSEAIPHIIFTDANPALIAAIQEEFPLTNTLHCMFHIAYNIPQNLKSSLRDCYDEFIKDFFDI
ncbi:10458_t:CDS:2 [Scutellospora calospora]|uniref:10458_t:CDS:1 n=1 Tax=Scutellospora calospora TaxID=85575 RepID=A0ACA9KLD3_9GLOM|nr:10458_t:CDS:2 [Scutellospora calospora]